MKFNWIPKSGESYFAIDFSKEDMLSEWIWLDDEFDAILYKRGLIFKTQEDAIAKAEEMLND
jgi:hypothetical protein